jgi:ribosomal protein L7/L12
MTTTLNCPKCGAPLEFNGGADLTITCPYCHNLVIVPEELRGSTATQSGGASTLDQLAQQSPRLAEMSRMIRAGQKIDAIKIYREIYRVGLKEAKDAVDGLERGEAINLPQ